MPNKIEALPSRSIATIYIVAIISILLGLVWGYCNLLKPKQFENPGLSVYRAPLGTRVHPLVSPELVAPPEAVLIDDTETVGESAEGRRARSAMAFSDGRDLQEKYESRRAIVAHLVKSWRRPRGVVMTLSPDRFSHSRNRALPPPIVGTSATIPGRAKTGWSGLLAIAEKSRPGAFRPPYRGR